MKDFRTTTLTLAGAFGFVVAALMAAANGLPFYSVPTQLIFGVLAASLAVLGVDLSLDSLGISFAQTERPQKPKEPEQ